MILKLLNWIATHRPTCLIKAPDGSPYLLRVKIKGRLPGEEETGRWSMYLHRFYAHDLDRALHNHPWTWSFSIILAGGYVEERRTVRTWVLTRKLKLGMVNVLGPNQFHRITQLNGKETWTLFITGRKVSEWGFWDRMRGFIPHRPRRARS